jgi:starch phosphorylase
MQDISGDAMSEPSQIDQPEQRLISTDVNGFDSLAELALDMHSSWNRAANPVWRQLAPVL